MLGFITRVLMTTVSAASAQDTGTVAFGSVKPMTTWNAGDVVPSAVEVLATRAQSAAPQGLDVTAATPLVEPRYAPVDAHQTTAPKPCVDFKLFTEEEKELCRDEDAHYSVTEKAYAYWHQMYTEKEESVRRDVAEKLALDADCTGTGNIDCRGWAKLSKESVEPESKESCPDFPHQCQETQFDCQDRCGGIMRSEGCASK
eukprot:TRINITY_DN49879_c0_g1_i1.p1 TRINITY_DN49879_c0_g1~~TRINITY_DN49879_c0_g1_i1.p1  ORF type:complete len:201 (+),score=37.30 TRINITY_DN49879_c0_g1_i1:93-695(+)